MRTEHAEGSALRHGGAVMVATQILRQPNLVRTVRASHLPHGMTLLLEVAVGDAEALAQAERLTGCAPATLVDAASFFVEQVLFTERASHYRVLGAHRDISPADLRYHMTLLMRWVHPDVTSARPPGQGDRGVFITRITAAWQTLKSSERRQAYDATLNITPAASGAAAHASPHPARSARRSKLALRPIEGDGLISRLLLFLQGRR